MNNALTYRSPSTSQLAPNLFFVVSNIMARLLFDCLDKDKHNLFNQGVYDRISFLWKVDYKDKGCKPTTFLTKVKRRSNTQYIYIVCKLDLLERHVDGL